MLSIALLAATTFASGSEIAASPGFETEIAQWRQARVERLQRPDGWLSLVGLHWLAPGAQRVGSAADNDIVLALGPENLGTIEVDAATARMTLAKGAQAQIGDSNQRAATLVSDAQGTPTVVRLGRGSFVVIERAGRLGLRVKDPEAVTRTGFVGIDYFDADPTWRFNARFEAHPPGKTIDIASVINTIDPMANPGVVIFEKNGKIYRLEAIDEGDGQLFLIFADRTSGKSTYGAGRFVYAPPPVDGRTQLDFNRAYNPPCAFNEYSTCPLPPPENRLDLVVEAGEKKYRGTH